MSGRGSLRIWPEWASRSSDSEDKWSHKDHVTLWIQISVSNGPPRGGLDQGVYSPCGDGGPLRIRCWWTNSRAWTNGAPSLWRCTPLRSAMPSVRCVRRPVKGATGADAVAHADDTYLVVPMDVVQSALACFAEVMGRMGLRTHPHKTKTWGPQLAPAPPTFVQIRAL